MFKKHRNRNQSRIVNKGKYNFIGQKVNTGQLGEFFKT
jgi:hypothetical protein